jgi:predicted PurR-regulated permease PerM
VAAEAASRVQPHHRRDPVTGIGSWIVRGAGVAVGAALVVGAIALAFAASKVLVLVFVAVILASGLQPVISWM